MRMNRSTVTTSPSITGKPQGRPSAHIAATICRWDQREKDGRGRGKQIAQNARAEKRLVGSDVVAVALAFPDTNNLLGRYAIPVRCASSLLILFISFSF